MKTYVAPVVAGAVLAAAGQALALNPLPPIDKPGLAVDIADFVQFPAASGSFQRDGINYLAESPDNSGRLFVLDSRGQIRIIDNGVASPNIFLNITTAPSVPGELDIDLVVGNFGQQGMGGFAFHPDYATPGADGFGRFYTAHSDNPSGKGAPDYASPGSTVHHSVITEWQVNPGNPNAIDTSSRRELLRIGQPFADHNMQQIGFNPLADPGDDDYGMMYVSMGDGGNNFPPNPTDPFQGGQNPGTPLGALLRIDPLGSNSANGAYGIPADNPFIGDPDLQHTLTIDESTTPADESLGEVWAYGARNPHRFSWDTGLNGTANMFFADIGQASIEEINLGFAGANYGWRNREGTFRTNPNNENELFSLPVFDDDFGYSYPVAQYDHDEGLAVVGGFVYRGQAISTLQGKYVFGDLVNGRMFYTDVDEMTLGNQADVHELTLFHQGSEQTLLQIMGNQPRADLRFGVDSEGEIYVIGKRTGEVFRLVPRVSIDGDLDGDGFVGIEDLNTVLGNWNAGTPPHTNANIPEPGAALILMGALATFLHRR
jgi:hypothetical protein